MDELYDRFADALSDIMLVHGRGNLSANERAEEMRAAMEARGQLTEAEEVAAWLAPPE
jgi:hypothetical protein